MRWPSHWAICSCALFDSFSNISALTAGCQNSKCLWTFLVHLFHPLWCSILGTRLSRRSRFWTSDSHQFSRKNSAFTCLRYSWALKSEYWHWLSSAHWCRTWTTWRRTLAGMSEPSRVVAGSWRSCWPTQPPSYLAPPDSPSGDDSHPYRDRKTTHWASIDSGDAAGESSSVLVGTP